MEEFLENKGWMMSRGLAALVIGAGLSSCGEAPESRFEQDESKVASSIRADVGKDADSLGHQSKTVKAASMAEAPACDASRQMSTLVLDKGDSRAEVFVCLGSSWKPVVPAQVARSSDEQENPDPPKNGEDGDDGEDGKDGKDGISVLSRSTLKVSESCGYEVVSVGHDQNQNLDLDGDEILTSLESPCFQSRDFKVFLRGSGLGEDELLRAPLVPFASQDQVGQAEAAVSHDGREVRLYNNMWRSFELGGLYRATANSRIRFKFASSFEAEIYGLHLYHSADNTSAHRRIQIGGTQKDNGYTIVDYPFDGSQAEFDFQMSDLSSLSSSGDHPNWPDQRFNHILLFSDHDAEENRDRAAAKFQDLELIDFQPVAVLGIGSEERTADIKSFLPNSQDKRENIANSSPDGRAVVLAGNTWKYLDIGETLSLSPDEDLSVTVQVLSSGEPEVIGIGFVSVVDSLPSEFRFAKLGGSQDVSSSNHWKTVEHGQTFSADEPREVTFQLKEIGMSVGEFSYIVLINDHDEGASDSKTTFLDLRLERR